MRIFSKKTFEFRKREVVDGQSQIVETVTVMPGIENIKDVPDWVKKDPLFEWAKKDGDIEILESKKDEKKAEKKAAEGDKTPPPKEKNTPPTE